MSRQPVRTCTGRHDAGRFLLAPLHLWVWTIFESTASYASPRPAAMGRIHHIDDDRQHFDSSAGRINPKRHPLNLPSQLEVFNSACDSILVAFWLVIETQASREVAKRNQLIVKPIVDAVRGLFNSRKDRTLCICEQSCVLEPDGSDPLTITLGAARMWKQTAVVAIPAYRLCRFYRCGLAYSAGLLSRGFILFRRPPLVGMVNSVAVPAGAIMNPNDLCDIAEGDVAKTAQDMRYRQVKCCQMLLPFVVNSLLNVSRCKQAMRALPGARSVLVAGLAIGLGSVLVNQVATNEHFTTAVTEPGLGVIVRLGFRGSLMSRHGSRSSLKFVGQWTKFQLKTMQRILLPKPISFVGTVPMGKPLVCRIRVLVDILEGIGRGPVMGKAPFRGAFPSPSTVPPFAVKFRFRHIKTWQTGQTSLLFSITCWRTRQVGQARTSCGVVVFLTSFRTSRTKQDVEPCPQLTPLISHNMLIPLRPKQCPLGHGPNHGSPIGRMPGGTLWRDSRDFPSSKAPFSRHKPSATARPTPGRPFR